MILGSCRTNTIARYECHDRNSPVSSRDVPNTAPKQGMIKFERRWFFSLTVLAAALLIGFIVWQIGSIVGTAVLTESFLLDRTVGPSYYGN